MKVPVTYYRTLVWETEVDVDSLTEAKNVVETEVSDMHNADFSLVHAEEAEIHWPGQQVPVKVTII